MAKRKAKEKTQHPPGMLVVVNPRGIPRGRHIFRDVRGGKEVGRWYEGDVYEGSKAEHLLERGLIVLADGGEMEVKNDG